MTKHTCKPRGKVGHLITGCPRCDELLAGAPKRSYVKRYPAKPVLMPLYTAIRAAMEAHDYETACEMMRREQMAASDELDKSEWNTARLALDRKMIYACVGALRRACHLKPLHVQPAATQPATPPLGPQLAVQPVYQPPAPRQTQPRVDPGPKGPGLKPWGSPQGQRQPQPGAGITLYPNMGRPAAAALPAVQETAQENEE